MFWSSVLAFAAFAQAQRAGGGRGGGMSGGGAMLRFGCSQVVIERLDP